MGQMVNRVQDFMHSAPSEWGKLVRRSANGKNSLFELECGQWPEGFHLRDLGVIFRRNLHAYFLWRGRARARPLRFSGCLRQQSKWNR